MGVGLQNLISLLGLVTILFIAWCISEDRKSFNYRAVLGGLGLQFALALFVLKTSIGQSIFEAAKDFTVGIISLSDEGARFVFGDTFTDHFFAFKVLPTIIFISAVTHILFYWGILQKFVELLAMTLQKALNISGAEGLVAAANIFCGQTEAPLFVRPYIKGMTRSEITTMMTTGMATAAGGVLAAYVGMGISAGHLLAASVMSAPAAVVIAKIIRPEDQVPETQGTVKCQLEMKEVNIFEAACNGAGEGLKLALNVGAMLITFIALIALINSALSFTGFTLQELLGYVFRPLAFMIGVEWQDSLKIGSLLGEKMVLNEFIAYAHLSEMTKEALLSERSINIATYALCGFANFSSIAVQIGGIGALEPSRRSDFARYGFKAMIGGTLAAMMTGSIAGILL